MAIIRTICSIILHDCFLMLLYIILNNIPKILINGYISTPDNIIWLLKVTLFNVTVILFKH